MKASTKNIAINDRNKEAVTFVQTIEFAELFEHLQEVLSVKCSFLQPKIATKHGHIYVAFNSEDITMHAGVFSAVLRRCYIHSHSSGVGIDKKTGKPMYWVVANIRYEQIDGGSNSVAVLRAWYSCGKWTFLDAGSNGPPYYKPKGAVAV